MLAAVIWTSNVECQEKGSTQLDEAIAKFESCSESRSAGAALTRILKFEKDHAQALLAHSNLSLSLRCAWDLAPSQTVNLVGGDWAWFVGFCRGKTGLEIPVRWEAFLCSEYYRENPKLRITVLKNYLPKTTAFKDNNGILVNSLVNRQKISDDLFAPSSLDVKWKGADLVVSFDKHGAMLLPAKLISEAKKPFLGRLFVSAILVGDKGFAVIYDVFGSGYNLMCLNPTSGALLWETKVWAMGTENLAEVSGLWLHEVSLTATKNAIAVFGHGPSCYAESFDIRNGKPFFRFSTNSWFMK